MTFLYELGIILIVSSLITFIIKVLEDLNYPYPLPYFYGDILVFVSFIIGCLCVLIYLFS